MEELYTSGGLSDIEMDYNKEVEREKKLLSNLSKILTELQIFMKSITTDIKRLDTDKKHTKTPVFSWSPKIQIREDYIK